MSDKIWTRVVRCGAGGHPTAQVVQLRKDAQVLDALMDPTGAVVLTYTSPPTDSIEERVLYLYESGAVITDGAFVRTLRQPDSGALCHVFIADPGVPTVRNGAAATQA
jgi:hypothetical protein